MRTLLLAGLLLVTATAGCFGGGATFDTIVIELDNGGETAHTPLVRVTGPDGILFEERVSVPASGSGGATVESAGKGTYTIFVDYSRTNNQNGNSQTIQGSHSHTLEHDDCEGQNVRVIFAHALTQEPGRQVFNNNGSQASCEDA